MRFQNSPEINELASEQRFPGRNRIQEDPERQLPDPLLRRQILRHHDQTIPEIEKYLPFISFGQRPAPYMIYNGSRTGIDGITRQLQPPAKIDLLLVRKKVTIQPSQLMIQRRPDKQGRTASPKYRLRVIILPFILFTY